MIIKEAGLEKRRFCLRPGVVFPRDFAGSGFTLVEVLVVTALAVVIILIGGGVFLSNSRFYESESGKIQSINSLREAADRINEYARQASSLVESYNYDLNEYVLGSETLILRLLALDGSDRVIVGVYDYVVISRDPNSPNRFWLIVDPDLQSTRLSRELQLTDRLDSVEFIYDNPNFVLSKNITFNLEITSAGRFPSTQRASGGTTLRN